VAAGAGHQASCHLRLHDPDVLDTTARQAFHLGFQVDFLSDATGTLFVQNSAGSISASDLHRAVLVIMAAKFASVVKTEEWIAD
jgi:nicotinamidase-related amidase